MLGCKWVSFCISLSTQFFLKEQLTLFKVKNSLICIIFQENLSILMHFATKVKSSCNIYVLKGEMSSLFCPTSEMFANLIKCYERLSYWSQWRQAPGQIILFHRIKKYEVSLESYFSNKTGNRRRKHLVDILINS